MPLYDYRCPDCGKEWENARTIADRNNEECLKCNTKAEILITTVARPQVFFNYYSEGLGAEITGPKQRVKLMREKGLEEKA